MPRPIGGSVPIPSRAVRGGARRMPAIPNDDITLVSGISAIWKSTGSETDRAVLVPHGWFDSIGICASPANWQ